MNQRTILYARFYQGIFLPKCKLLAKLSLDSTLSVKEAAIFSGIPISPTPGPTADTY
jgi:hypothetical protein